MVIVLVTVGNKLTLVAAFPASTVAVPPLPVFNKTLDVPVVVAPPIVTVLLAVLVPIFVLVVDVPPIFTVATVPNIEPVPVRPLLKTVALPDVCVDVMVGLAPLILSVEPVIVAVEPTVNVVPVVSAPAAAKVPDALPILIVPVTPVNRFIVPEVTLVVIVAVPDVELPLIVRILLAVPEPIVTSPTVVNVPTAAVLVVEPIFTVPPNPLKMLAVPDVKLVSIVTVGVDAVLPLIFNVLLKLVLPIVTVVAAPAVVAMFTAVATPNKFPVVATVLKTLAVVTPDVAANVADPPVDVPANVNVVLPPETVAVPIVTLAPPLPIAKLPELLTVGNKLTTVAALSASNFATTELFPVDGVPDLN